MIPPIPSSIVTTVFCFALASLSTIQFFRSKTPLRLGAAVMAVFGLSIAALSIVYAVDRVSLSVFWVYQFLAECISLTWIITTIIHLGYAFYPLTRHQTFIWRTALGSVLLYDAVAIAELSYYCYAVYGSGSLTREATPVLWIYWVRQVVKVIALAVTVAYLFVPLVRHHHNTGVAMIADSNTLAVGTWYLSSLGMTTLGYFCMFIYYMTKSKAVFDPQAQNLDLCIRLIACPIFSLPPPRILLSYFQEKYGSTVRDDNPNTMVEEGITNDPRPRRPAMLVNLPTAHSARRSSQYMFDPPSSRRISGTPFPTVYPTQEQEEDARYKNWGDEEINIGSSTSDPATINAASSISTAALDSPGQREVNTSSSTESAKESRHFNNNLDPTTSHILSALSISGLSTNPEPPKAPRKISRRLTADVLPSLIWDLTSSALTSSSLPTPTAETNALRNIPASKRGQRSKIGGVHGTSSVDRIDKMGVISSSSILEENERVPDENPPRSQAHAPHEGLQEITSGFLLDSVRVASREAITWVGGHGNSTSTRLRHGSTLGPNSPTMLRTTRSTGSGSTSVAESVIAKPEDLGPLGIVESASQ